MINLTWEIISKWDIVPRICRKVFKRKIHRYLPDHKSKTNLSVNVRMSGEKGRKVWQIGSGSFRGNVCVFYRGARFIAKKVFLVVSVVIGKNGSEVFRSFFRLHCQYKSDEKIFSCFLSWETFSCKTEKVVFLIFYRFSFFVPLHTVSHKNT